MEIIKACLLITLISCLCTSVMASKRFVVKYKPDELQTSSLLRCSDADEKNRIKEQIRVQMIKKLSQGKVDALSRDAGFQVRESHAISSGAHVILLSKNLNKEQTERFIRNVKQDNNVEYIEEDLEVEAAIANVNPNFQWDMVGRDEFQMGAGVKWGGDDFVNAWKRLDDYGYIPGQNVIVAVLDTGYTPNPNIVNNLIPLNGAVGIYGYKFISDCRVSGECQANTPDIDAENNPNSRYTPDGLDLVGVGDYHGTHVTGTIIGSGYNLNNPSYIAGGAYGSRVIPIRVLGRAGAGGNRVRGFVTDLAEGMKWAVGFQIPNVKQDDPPVPINANLAQIINLSMAGRVNQCPAVLQEAVNDVIDAGAVVVAAAGNDHTDVGLIFPANCNGVISVAAKGPTNSLAWYSDYGDTTITASGGDNEVFLQSPLPLVRSTAWAPRGEYLPPENGGHGDWNGDQGTSMAAPHVSAAIAILIGIFKAQNKPYTLQQIKNILETTSTRHRNRCSRFGCATDRVLDVRAMVDYILLPSISQRLFILNMLNRRKGILRMLEDIENVNSSSSVATF